MRPLALAFLVVPLTVGCGGAPGEATPAGPGPAPPVTGSLAAFPGAEGFGALATGGRGGRVVFVTTLAASGPGSLQDALDQEGPRTVVFRVSGVIDAAVHLSSGDVTIAGQTSPGGIVVRGFVTDEEPYCDGPCPPPRRYAENWILRHLRIRPAGGGSDDGLRLRRTRAAIVDHCSIANASDEAVEISYSNGLTVQECLLAETIGDHADRGGMLLNYSDPASGFALDRIAILKNAWVRILGRLPEISRESAAAAGSVFHLELSNNLVHDPGRFSDIAARTFPYEAVNDPVHTRMNWVGNLWVARPGFPYGAVHLPANEPEGSLVFASGNRLSLWPGRADFDLFYCCDDYATAPVPPRPAYASDARIDLPPIDYLPVGEVQEQVASRAGAFPRDPMDRRLLAHAAAGTFDPAPRDANPYGDAFATDFDPAAPPAPPADDDADGLPDDWEVVHGLDPERDDAAGTTLSRLLLGVEGYTNLECWLHELSEKLLRGR